MRTYEVFQAYFIMDYKLNFNDFRKVNKERSVFQKKNLIIYKKNVVF